VAEDALCDRGEGPQGSAPSAPRLLADDASLDGLAREDLLMDIHMMVAGGGRERAETEYHALLVKAGLRPTRVIRTPGPLAIIEAEPA
jgi:hypothetical protein